MKILLVDNYDSFTYNLLQLLEEFGAETIDIVKNNAITLSAIAQYDKILLSPGAGLPAEAGFMCDMIRQYAPTKSILGICLGHQAIGEVFGASLFNLPQVYHGLTIEMEITDTQNYLFQNIPLKSKVGLYHSWAVSTDNFPQTLQITAKSADVVMGVRHIEYDVQGLQFHPESIMSEYGQEMVYNWLKG